MTINQGEKRYGFKLIEERRISEIEGVGKVFVHERTNVTVIALSNKDPHKVFGIHFKTLPRDNKGAAHIVEHAVCCASKNYPLKETFMALGQGSICTTMNACTYPDRTMYYAASPNEKDLLGVMGVYIDLVFHPSIETSNHYFLQEGWHYELEAMDAPLDVSGVVYHEMLGEYGEASTYLQYYEQKAMFPDTSYQFEAGGLPEEIITLSEKEFLDFYYTHYVGDNCVITLYGDLSLEKYLQTLDEVYLKDIRRGHKISAPKLQTPFEKPQTIKTYYPTSLQNAPTLLSLSFQVGGCIDAEERLGLEMLEHMLLRSTASPLLETIVIDQQLGMSLSDGGYDSCRMQPVFSITLKGTKEENAHCFEQAIIEVMQALVEEGIDQKLVQAAIETLEFELMENDDSYEPAGILYGEMMVTSLYGGGDVFEHLSYKTALEKIKALAHKGYFENLIKKYFLNNPHRLLTILSPSEGLMQEKQMKLEKRLAKKKSELTKEECRALIQLNAELEAAQLIENSSASLACLPKLNLEDLPETLEKLVLTEEEILGCPTIFHLDDAKEISYFHFLWEVDTIPTKAWHTLGLLAHIFTYVGTESKSFSEVENAINTHTGSMSVALHAYQDEKTRKTKPIFKVSCKVLKRHLEAFKALMIELFLTTQFTEKEKLREQIGHIVYEFERSFSGAPEYRSVQRVYAYLSPEGRYEDEVAGVAFYHYLKEVYEQFDMVYEQLAKDLKELLQQIVLHSPLKMCVTCKKEDKEQIKTVLFDLIRQIPVKKKADRIDIDKWFNAHPILEDEGFINGQEGQAIAKAINFKAFGIDYKGQLEVVANILENTFLWDRVRLNGGAYGCDILLTKEGYASVCSYCDPNLSQTLSVFEQMGAYLKKIRLSEDVISRVIVSTMGAMLSPLSMEQKSERACNLLITGTPQEIRQQIYDEIRRTTLNDFYEAARLFELLGKKGRCCVMGNKETLKAEKTQLTLIDLNI